MLHHLPEAIARKQAEARKKAGLGDSVGAAEAKAVSMRGSTKTIQNTRKLMEAPQRLLQEEDINEIHD